MATRWVVLAYTLPPEPSRKRVAAWRRLRKLGAVYLAEGIWFLPATATNEREIANIVREIRDEGGTAWSFRAEDLSKTQETDLSSHFNAAREDEYAEVLGHCERFLSHMKRAMEGNEFTFSRMEEFEQDLEKRLRLLKQVRERDVLGATGSGQAEVALQECRAALDAYAEAVFLHAR